MICNSALTRWKTWCDLDRKFARLLADDEKFRRLQEDANEAELPLTSVGPGEIGGPYQRERWR